MANKQYFNFLGTVYDLLPPSDKDRMGELWHGYEQIFGSVYQKFLESDLSIVIQDTVLFNTERWLPYTFDATNSISRKAKFTGNQDLSIGANLTNRYLLRFSINGGPAFEVDCRGVNPVSTSIDEIKAKINLGAGFEFARGAFENSVLEFESNLAGPTSTITFLPATFPAADAIEFLVGLLQTDLPITVPEFKFVYDLPHDRIAKIPELSDKIRDESVETNLIEGTDYRVNFTENFIEFRNEPPASMWAKRTNFDEETPWNNWGFLMDIYQKNSEGYLRAVQGLWFAFWSGPKPENVRRAIYLLFGLPVAQETCTVTSVSPTVVTTQSPAGVERAFAVPPGLVPIVTVGQEVVRFQPLIDGIDVFDKINRPGFIKDEIGRPGIQRFLLDEASRGPGDTDETKALRLLEEHTFLPQISVDAFISPDINLSNVKTFLEAIKPLSKTFLFQVIVGTFLDEIEFKEKLTMEIGMDVTPNLDSNQTTFLTGPELTSYETIDNEAMDLDSDGVLFQESVEVEVYSFGNLIDSFVA